MSRFSLDGTMIPRTVRRIFDERSEPRTEAESSTAVLELRGRKHVVRVLNLSPSGAMLSFALVPHIGERVSLQLLDRGPVAGHVRWVRDGKIGVNFATRVE